MTSAPNLPINFRQIFIGSICFALMRFADACRNVFGFRTPYIEPAYVIVNFSFRRYVIDGKSALSNPFGKWETLSTEIPGYFLWRSRRMPRHATSTRVASAKQLRSKYSSNFFGRNQRFGVERNPVHGSRNPAIHG